MPQVETQIADLTARIEAIDTALSGAAGGASYSIGGRTLTRQAMADLREERGRLVRERKQARAVMQGADNPGIAVATWHR